ncbi:MAG: hypothetical protein QOI55_2933 [Actinomycetota bacterium]|nr:hypothetical protein [Actinomycetota bacterium]
MRRFLILVTAAVAASGFAAAPLSASPPSPSTPGMFVVGDLSTHVGAHVEFWGAQWSQDNNLSGGAAPAAFKGFADSVDDATCPTHWSTGPGNSPHPPATISSDITVIVTSSVTKSGPVITGDVVELVTVHVDNGYAGDPGHPGTGTVTGIVSANSCGGGGGTSNSL